MTRRTVFESISGLDQSGTAVQSGWQQATPPADTPEPEIGRIDLGGRSCRIVLVDGMVPTHSAPGGSRRVRLTYLPCEIGHFEFDGHRYAIVSDPVPASLAPDPALSDRRAVHELMTNRELQVIQLVCLGFLTKQVADRLDLSEFTVRSYLKSIYAKLGVRSRAAMVCRYMQALKETG